VTLSFQNVDGFCAGVDVAQPRPVIDLSGLKFIDPFAVIYLGQFIRLRFRPGKQELESQRRTGL